MASGTPTTNLGLRTMTDADAVDAQDINYNSGILDTKIGAVGSTSLQTQVNTLNTRMASYKNDASTISELKTDLLTFVDTLSVNDVRNYSFWTGGSIEAPFSAGQLYAGDITVTAKSSNSSRFSAVFSCDNGTPVSVGYNNGTWKIEVLASRSYLSEYAATTLSIGSKFTMKSSRAQKIGLLVFVTVVAEATQAYGSTDTIAIVPVGYRPTRDTPPMRIELHRTNSETYIHSTFGNVGTSGIITQTITTTGGQVGDTIVAEFVYSLI